MTTEGRRRFRHGRRPSRRESEVLLDGAGSGALHELLAAASGPARRDEIAGEAVAVDAFVAARRGGVALAEGTADTALRSTTHRRTAWWRTPSRLVAALALALVSAGVAVGTAATVLRDAPPSSPPASSVPAPVRGGATTVGPHPLPEPARIAACRDWQSAGASSATRATDPAFTPLISAAGGSGNVDGFCAATPAPGAASPSPTSAGSPSVPASRTPADVSRGEGASGTDTGSPTRTGAGRDEGAGGGDGGADGRAVGPPATPPGQASNRSGPANGRSVGPPSVPPGQDRAQQRNDSTPRGEGQRQPAG